MIVSHRNMLIGLPEFPGQDVTLALRVIRAVCLSLKSPCDGLPLAPPVEFTTYTAFTRFWALGLRATCGFLLPVALAAPPRNSMCALKAEENFPCNHFIPSMCWQMRTICTGSHLSQQYYIKLQGGAESRPSFLQFDEVPTNTTAR